MVQGALFSPETYANRNLFADHYLRAADRLLADPEWREPGDIAGAFAAVKTVFLRALEEMGQRTTESPTEETLVRPILRLLWDDASPGDTYCVQAPVPVGNRQLAADYALFPNAAVRRAALPYHGTTEFWSAASGIGEAKRWSVPLNRIGSSGLTPGQQLTDYLYRTNVRWGILTNGRLWRLYEREKSRAGGTYYEVDLQHLIEADDLEKFKYFFLFFRRQAFLSDDTGKSFLDRVAEGSAIYATGVSDSLKDSVYDALRLIITGFFEQTANGLQADDPAHIRAAHDLSLVVLYRLLFIFYAEHKKLLPDKDPTYATISLAGLQEGIHKQLIGSNTYSRATRRHWQSLMELFAVIDHGLPDNTGKMVIPEYNGGLFSPAHYPHIAYEPQTGYVRWNIGDYWLAEAIDTLAYQREKWHEPGIKAVDYAALDVEHLGSIYEGLLELRPHFASVPMIETMQDGKPVYKPAADLTRAVDIKGQKPRRIGAGEIYLVTSRGERKATGSYYTPKYIVNYIVENTIDPLTTRAAAEVAALRPAVDAEIARLRQREQAVAGNDAELAKTRTAIEEQKRRLLQPYLDLKVLDPAMGSGHFLVGAADFLSRAMATDFRLLLPADGEDEDPQAYYKRLVVESCLYGVDRNPLAVELAKLSLWLHTVSRDKALSFLDHHLRNGNSLIGARLETDLGREPQRFTDKGVPSGKSAMQLPLGVTQTLTSRHLESFLTAFRMIVESPSGTATDTHRKESVYRDMDVIRHRYRSVANLWLAPYFNVFVTREQYERAVHVLGGDEAEWMSITAEEWFATAQRAAKTWLFFHWELEFPEVFFNATGWKASEERGFAAIIGNPPYFNVDIFGKQSLEQHYLKYRYPEIWQDKSDILFYFLGIGLRLGNGPNSFIVSNAFLASDKAKSLRRSLATQRRIRALVDFRDFMVFDAGISTAVLLLDADTPRPQAPALVISRADTPVTSVMAALEAFGVGDANPVLADARLEHVSLPADGSPWTIAKGDDSDLIARIDAPSTKLGSLFTLGEGMQTGLNEAFALKEQPPERDRQFWRTRVQGEQIGRYLMEMPTSWLIWAEDLETPDQGPTWLSEQIRWHEEGLRKRAAFQRGNCLWFKFTWPLHRELYHHRKLWCSYRASHNAFTLDDSGQMIGLTSTTVIFDTNDEYDINYLLSLVNSKLLTWRYSFIGKKTGSGLMEYFENQIAKLPVRTVQFSTDLEHRALLLRQGQQLYDQGTESPTESSLLAFVAACLAHDPEQSDVVHDLLAYLAEQMTEMHKQKQAETRGFLTWLEGRTGAAVDDLTGKTAVREYFAKPIDDLIGVLEKNRKKFRASVNPAERSFVENVQREYARSVAVVGPLSERIAATDRLIDQIVYRLYGLTDDEIALVEGAVK